MGGDEKRTVVLILAALVLLCALISPTLGDEPGNYICIGNCPPGEPTQPANQPPVFDDVPDQVIAEGSFLTFAINASDPDNDISYYTGYIPDGSNVDENGANFTFTWVPDYTQAGQYYANFTVYDASGLTDSLNVFIEVTNTNRPPVLKPMGHKVVAEGSLLMVSVQASDPDEGDTRTFSCDPLPLGAIFEADGYGNYTFTWVPGYDQSGSYFVTFAVADREGLIDNEFVSITVEPANRPPVLDRIGDQTIAEGAILIIPVRASDPDQDEIEFIALGSPVHSTFEPDGFGNYSFIWIPGYDQSGAYHVNFTVSDGSAVVFENVVIMVLNTNRAPELAPIGNKLIQEGITLTFPVTATDPDGDTLEYAAQGLPLGATFVNRQFQWTPGYDQTGVYTVNFTVTDSGGMGDSERINITVSNINRPPVMDGIGTQTVAEGATRRFAVNATDPDGNPLVFSASALPLGARFDPGINGNYSFNWIPGYEQSGLYHVNFTVSDGNLLDYENVTINVINTNRAPVIDPIENKMMGVGWTITFPVNASDPDRDLLTWAWTLPAGASFTNSGKNYTFLWTASSVGQYWANVTVRDSGGLIGTVNISLSVVQEKVLAAAPINHPPVFVEVGAKTVWETYELKFTVQASDPDGDPLIFTNRIPSGASVTKSGVNTYVFSWRPLYNQTGLFWANFTITDGSNLLDLMNVPITVTEEPFPSCDCI
jgi:PKD repeat protein